MIELLRDTAFGHLLRLLSRNRLLRYREEQDPTIWTQYIDVKKSANLANHGSTEPAEDGPNLDGLEKVETREDDEFVLEPPQTRPGQLRRPTTQSGGYLQELNSVTLQRTNSARSRPADTQQTRVNQASGVPVDPEKGRDLHLVTWYGDDDPENPMNWSAAKKCFVTFEICLLTTSVYIGSSIYSAGEQSVEMTFGVGQVPATLGLTLFVAGYGLGPMLWSPMSEIPVIGRNPIYLATLAVFVAFQAPTALADNFGMLMAFRFLTGFFGSPVLATGGASIADIWSPQKRAYAMSIWGIAAVCGPTLGPLIGGFAAEYAPIRGGFTASWTWPIWELMWLSGFCLVFLFFLFPETSANNILYRRAARLRKLTGDLKLKTEPELVAESMSGMDIVMMALVRPFTLNFLEPMVFLLNLYIALIYGLLYVWFESFVDVFVGIYGFGLGTEGLAFLGIFVGALLVIPPFFSYLHWVVEPQFDADGNIQPEKRLPPCFVGAFCIPICLFWFGWSSRPDVHWIVPIIGSGWFSIGAFLLFNSILNYLPDAYPEYAASVLAGNDFMRSMVGAGFPLFAGAMFHNLGIAWASSTLAFISIAFIPIPFVLYKFGPTLRNNYSRYARKDMI